MPLELQIIRAREFVRVGPEGDFDLEASKAALAALARACRKRRIPCALLDLRALTPGPLPRFAPTDLMELVDTFHQIGFNQRDRVAVLYRSDPHHRARMFAFIGKRRGWSVRAFDDLEPALLWLSERPTEAPHCAERPIPVRHRASPNGDARHSSTHSHTML